MPRIFLHAAKLVPLPEIPRGLNNFCRPFWDFLQVLLPDAPDARTSTFSSCFLSRIQSVNSTGHLHATLIPYEDMASRFSIFFQLEAAGRPSVTRLAQCATSRAPPSQGTGDANSCREIPKLKNFFPKPERSDRDLPFCCLHPDVSRLDECQVLIVAEWLELWATKCAANSSRSKIEYDRTPMKIEI